MVLSASPEAFVTSDPTERWEGRPWVRSDVVMLSDHGSDISNENEDAG